MQFLNEFHTILKKISHNFQENFTQFLREFHSTFKNISLKFEIKNTSLVIFKEISGIFRRISFVF